jgi:predicted PurR-regulated permease PerM
MRTSSAPSQTSAGVVAFSAIVAVGAAACLMPMWSSLLLAAWFAMLGRPLSHRIAKRLGGRRSAASGLLTLALLLLLVAPFAMAVLALYGSAVDLLHRVAGARGIRDVLQGLVSGGNESGAQKPSPVTSTTQLTELARQYGARAWNVFGKIAGATATALLGVFIFLYATFVFLVDGERIDEWLETHAPLPSGVYRRFAGAFAETGRGLLIGNGLTALTQATVATIAYFALGVPRALLLGLLTMIAALIPSVGTALVWVPVAAGLALTGRTTQALIMAAIGIVVIGTIDNVVRPVFSRFGQLHMPAFLILVSIFGGVAIFGMWGLLLGPLFVRLTLEAAEVLREQREQRTSG